MVHNTKIIAVVLAGGSGTRFDNDWPKQYCYLHDKMLIEYSLDILTKIPLIDEILVVVSKEHEQFYSNIIKKYDLLACIEGGSTRLESVKNAISYLAKYLPDQVLIHDACRPLISSNFINNLLSNIKDAYDVICPALKITETLKEIIENKVENIDRANKYIIQTPQVIKFSTYHKILEDHTVNFADFTDDSSLVASFGGVVKYIEGDSVNIKITLKNDIEFAKKMLEKTKFRTGIGFDAHKFSANESLENFIMLGGVKIPYVKSMIAHSDGDVVIHAVVDAILGAIGAGDIGEHFPDTDPQWKGQDSAIFLQYAHSLLANKNAEISNVDIIIVCEAPKISFYKDKMKANLSSLMKITTEQVNIKATTTETMGFTGRKEGIAVYAMVTVKVF